MSLVPYDVKIPCRWCLSPGNASLSLVEGEWAGWGPPVKKMNTKGEAGGW